jgi:hypothetical protein
MIDMMLSIQILQNDWHCQSSGDIPNPSPALQCLFQGHLPAPPQWDGSD